MAQYADIVEVVAPAEAVAGSRFGFAFERVPRFLAFIVHEVGRPW